MSEEQSNAARIREINESIRYTMWSVFRLAEPLGDGDRAAEGAEVEKLFAELAEGGVVVRGDLGAREFVAFWLDDSDRIRAAMNVNVWDVVDEVRPLIANRVVVDPDRLADQDTAYADVGR